MVMKNKEKEMLLKKMMDERMQEKIEVKKRYNFNTGLILTANISWIFAVGCGFIAKAIYEEVLFFGFLGFLFSLIGVFSLMKVTGMFEVFLE